ncbi:MAG: hypothetical protein HC836_15550 [Richelia sp. RM2_1_2]|nr:hypothetical protein [Richelia sp. RM2_1_2]
MSDFLKKLKDDLEEGKKTEYVEKFNEIIEKADSVDISAVKEKIEDIDFQELGLLGTVEDVEESSKEHAEYIAKIKLHDDLLKEEADIINLNTEISKYQALIDENKSKITTLQDEFFEKYGFTFDDYLSSKTDPPTL